MAGQEYTQALPIACDLDVFSAEDNKRHETFLNKALAAIQGVQEVEDGYALSFSSNDFLTIAEWISLERRCCNFLSFHMRLLGGDELFSLTVSGPTGTKELLSTFLKSPKYVTSRLTEQNNRIKLH